MSSFIYLVTMVSVAWLVFWAIRDPKQPNWEWWPIEWWPFDTQSEEAAAVEAERQAATEAASSRRAIPWRERRKTVRRPLRAVRRQHHARPWH